MENILAIVLGLILMLPLLIQLRTPVIRSWKVLMRLQCYLTEYAKSDVRWSERNLVQHYPKLPDLLNSSYESRMMVCPARTILSSPAMPPVTSSVHGYEKLVRKTIPLAQHSSPFIATQSELPVVDITCNYDSYRYESFERSLKKRYGMNYPPGEVVLNYIQLNNSDSKIKIENEVGNDLLDAFEERNNGAYTSILTKFETDYLNLLDHFILKQQKEKTLTEGKFTETLVLDERNLEASSYTDTWSQCTLKSSAAQEKESRSSNNNNQCPARGIESRRDANRHPNGPQKVFKRR